MRFVNCYLPYFRQQFICCLLSAVFFSRLCLLKVWTEFSSLPLPLSLGWPEHPTPSAACPFQFFVYYSCFFVCGGDKCQSIEGAMQVYPRGGCGSIAYLLTCWSVSPKQVWSWHLVAHEPSCFLSVMWHEEALYGLRVWAVGVLLLLGGFPCQVCLQSLSKVSDLWSSCCLFPSSSLGDLGSLPHI
jgi:hypothetical protein